MGLLNAAHLPSVKQRKAALAEQARRLFKQELQLFGQINENTNGKDLLLHRSCHTSLASVAPLTVVEFSGILGVGSDSVRANSYYHWGALHALVAIAEERAYPSPMLGGQASQASHARLRGTGLTL